MTKDDKPHVTLAGPDDALALAALFAAMDLHYQGVTVPEGEWLPKVEAHLDEAENGTLYALAWMGGRPVGIACFVLLRHGLHYRGSLFLKDLFVIEEARGSGAGEALMRFLAAFARDHGVDRIDLTVDAPNEGAARFYARLGADPVAEKHFYRFEVGALMALAPRGKGKA